MAAAAPSTKARRFAAACGVLSRCVKSAERTAEARPVALPLMPGADMSVQEERAAAPAPAQMTIFFGGLVLVLDEFPADRAAELLRFAAAAGTAQGNGEVADDLPMARKASLQRFMKKRKGRLAARGVPYRRPDVAHACSDHLTLAL